jgi:hypothetical protein
MTDQEHKEWEGLSAVVKAGSFMSLKTQEQRNRYKELKAKIDAETQPLGVTKAELEKIIDERVKEYKEEAKKLYENVEGLEEAQQLGKWLKSKKPVKENPVAKLRVYREDGLSQPGLIIDWKFKKNEFDEETRKYNIPIYQITVLYDDDSKKTYDIPLISMAEIKEYEEVEIIKQKVEEQEMIVGTGRKAFTKDGYVFSSIPGLDLKPQMPGEAFNYTVTRKDAEVTIKRPNGRTLTLHVSRLNQ